MARNEQEAKEVQARMAALRERMTRSGERAATRARRWTDWRYYVKRFPLATVGIAAGVGYLLVPKRPQVVAPDADQIAEMVRREQLVVSPGPKRASSKSIAGSVLGIVAAGAARAAMAYVGNHFASGMTGRQVRNETECGQQPCDTNEAAGSGRRHPK